MDTEKKLTKKDEKLILELTEGLLKQLGVEATAKVTILEKEIQIDLVTEESGLLIGYHGEVLDSLAVVLALAIVKKTGAFYHVSVDVGDYKKNRMEYLKDLAAQTKERVLAEQREVALTGLKPWERRVVHLTLQEDPEVTSQSTGEGRDRQLVIMPRKD